MSCLRKQDPWPNMRGYGVNKLSSLLSKMQAEKFDWSEKFTDNSNERSRHRDDNIKEGKPHMTKKRKLIIYGFLLFVGLLSFILQIFVYQKPNDILGFVICVISVLMILVSILKLCILSSKFQNSFLVVLDVFTWLP